MKAYAEKVEWKLDKRGWKIWIDSLKKLISSFEGIITVNYYLKGLFTNFEYITFFSWPNIF